MKKKGLFLDLDGTLADTLPMLRGVYAQFMKEFGIKDSDAEFQELNGPPLDEVVRILKDRYSLPLDSKKLLDRYMELVRNQYLDARPNAGVSEILKQASGNGWICAVVTSNSEPLAREWLIKYNFLSMIHDVIGKESVKFGKPNPEPYLIALQRTQCSAEASIAVEDSAAGIGSAVKAKIRTFSYRLPQAVTVDGISLSNLTSFYELLGWLN